MAWDPTLPPITEELPSSLHCPQHCPLSFGLDWAWLGKPQRDLWSQNGAYHFQDTLRMHGFLSSPDKRP